MTERKVIQVLDFSGAFSGEWERFPEEAGARWNFVTTSFRDLEGTMCFCAENSAVEIRRRLRAGARMSDGRENETEGRIHWIDTGDYHYLTYFFLEQMDVPFTLVLLDNHPDDQPSVFGGDLLSCGGWVLTAMQRLPLMRRLVSAGPDGKVTVYNRDKYREDGWECVREERLERAAEVLREALPAGERVYVSLDKDVLSKVYARTDWSQGEMTLPQMLDLLTVLRERDVLGVDLCGGLTEAKGATGEDFAVNARTDAALLDAVRALVSRKG